MEFTGVIALCFSWAIGQSMAAPDNCAHCNCNGKQSSVCDLDLRVTWIERNIKVMDGKIAEWVKQQYHIQDLEIKTNFQRQEIIILRKKLEDLELENPQKSPKLAFLMQNDGTGNDVIVSDAPKSNTVIEELTQNMTLLHQKVAEIELTAIKNLTVEVSQLQGEIEEETRLRRSLQTKVSKNTELIKQTSEGLRRGITERFSTVEDSVNEIKRGHDEELTVVTERLSSVEDEVYSLDTCNIRLTTGQRNLKDEQSHNQRRIVYLNEQFSTAQVLLKYLQDEISNISKKISTMNSFDKLETVSSLSTFENETSPSNTWENIISMDPDLQGFYGYIEKLLSGNFSTYMEIIEQKLENTSITFQNQLERLSEEVMQLQNSVQFQEIDFNKNLSFILDYLKLAEEKHKETIIKLEEYFISIVNDWKKGVSAPHSLESFPSNKDGDEALPTDLENSIEHETNEDDETEELSCPLPQNLDMQLLVTIYSPMGLQHSNINQLQKISSGSRLMFGCHNIGSSILIDAESEEQKTGNSTLECLKGRWKGGEFPRCKVLMTESEIQELSMKFHVQNVQLNALCLNKRNYMPDTNDCAMYFMCSNGTLVHLRCNSPLLFNAANGHCDHPSNVACHIRRNQGNVGILEEREGHPDSVYFHDDNGNEDTDIQLLSSLTPTITVQPHRVNLPYSMMANGAAAELVVFPRTSITLNCLFPIPMSTPSPYPIWLINSSYPGNFRRSWPVKTAPYKNTLRLVSVTAEDSGIYSCVASNGKRNDIQLTVKAVECPPLHVESDNVLEIMYRTHPDVWSNVMTSQILFSCPHGHRIIGPSTAMCTAYGSWSHSPPLCQSSGYQEEGFNPEDSVKRNNRCIPPDLSQNQDLIFEPGQTNKTVYNVGDVLRFTCSSLGHFVNGPRRIVCMRHGRWSTDFLPNCVP